MLIRFTVENFLSFNNEQELSMNRGAADSFDNRISKDANQSILKFTALYGANASGKSNLVKSIDFARQLIVNNISCSDFSKMYFKLDPNNENLPTKLEFDLKIGNKYYGYGLMINLKDKKILCEWLVKLTPDGDILIYEREAKTNYLAHNIDFEDSKNKERFENYLKSANESDEKLIFSDIAINNDMKELSIVKDIYDWFKYNLIIIYPNSFVGTITDIFKVTDKRIINLLEYFDTGISGHELVASSINEIQKHLPNVTRDKIIESFKRAKADKSLNKDNNLNLIGTIRLDEHLYEIEISNDDIKVYEVLFKHNEASVGFTFGEESDGTRRLIELLDVVYNGPVNSTIIIDELDRSLHPQMTVKFVETFLNYSKNLKTQLIITTHESNLMNLDMLRKDEIWFVEKDAKLNETKLYSLDKFRIQNSNKIASDYLIGRYGAVPVFKKFESYVIKRNGNS